MHFTSNMATGPDTHPALRFRPVTVETMDDFTLFRSTHPPFANCSCMRWRLRNAEFTRSTKRERIRAFDALVEKGTPVGVLAYLDDVPVGWCSIAPHETFHGVSDRTEEAQLWTVTCFYVDPLHRRTGVSVRLLMAAVEYARSSGAKVVEGYPVEAGRKSRDSMGFLSVFRRAGFRDFASPGRKRHIMRNVVG